MINKAFKFRIYPNVEQQKYFNDSFRTSNFIFNYFLRQQVDIGEKMTEDGIVEKKERAKYMKDNELYFNKFGASSVLTTMGNTEEFSFLKNVDSTLKSYSLKNLDNAFGNMRKTGSGFPKFKNRFSNKAFTGQIQYRGEKTNGYSLVMNNNKFGELTIPKLKRLKISCHDEFFIENWSNKNIIKFNSYTISNKGNKFFIALQCEVNDPNYPDISENKEILENTTIGIDMGVSRPITTSDVSLFNEETFKNSISLLKEYKSELKRLSSILNRKRDYHKKNKSELKYYETTSYKRVKRKIENLYFKITEKRNYIQHVITKKLVNLDGVDTFILEELNIKGMTKRSSKGKSNNKSGLNRVLADVGMYAIRTKLEYKAKRVGKNVETVDPKYTSQKCSECGHTNKLNRQSQSKFKCIKCGHMMNADLNAAINIKNKFFNK